MAVGPDEFFKRLEESGLLNDSILAKKNQVLETDSAEGAAAGLVEQKLLTPYQGEVLVSGDQIPLVVGDYVVTDSIGRGGMGYVLKARHRRMKRQVAIKFLLKSLTESDDLRRRFEREVEAAAQLDHQNIVTAYDAGIHEGSHYLVMQYVDGDDLSHIVKSSGPLEIPKAVDVIRQAAVGLGYAHDQGIVHRDIKPGNLLLDGEGVVRILDMGLARMTPSPGDALEGGAQADLTNTGSVMGTIDYMAPEQALDAKSVDSRADLYALGCTLYFLVTGNPPFRNETVMRRLLAHREEPAPRISAYRPEASSELDQIFATMMAKSPDDRFPSMKHLVVALDSLELTDSEDEQMVTMDMPDDESGGFISVPDEDVLGLSDFGSDDESSTGSMTRKLPNSDATMLETPTHASAMSALENAVATSPAAASPDTDFTGIGETIIGDSPSALGIAADRSGTSGPPWKLIAPIVLAVVALIAFLMTRPGPAANSLDPTSPNTVLSLPQGATPPDESQSPDSSPLLDPDRRAAEWVLSVGGKIRHEAEWGYFDELPDGPFQLQGVDLTGSAATNEGLVNLRGLTHLGSINLLGTQITDQGLAVLTDSGRVPLPSLEILDARHLPISDDGIGYLAGSSHVRTLILSDTQVSDLRHICENFPELVRLTLEQTSVTGKSLVHLEKLRRLTVLEISGSQLRGGGTHVAKLTALKALSVSDASDGFESDVLTKLTNLDDLHLTGSSEDQLDGKFWSTVGGLPQLTGISFQGPGTTSAVLDQMPVLKQLRHLTIKLTSAGGAAIANAVKKQPQLESLHLGTSQLDDADAKSLEPLTALTTLGLQGNPDITVAAIESLQKALPHCRIESAHGVFGPDPAAMTPDRRAAEAALKLGGSVTVMDSAGSVLSITDPVELPAEPFAVTEINLLAKPGVDDASLTNFRGLTALRKLILTSPMVTDSGLANLTDEGREPLQALQFLYLAGTDISQDGLQFLSGSSDLGSLFLSETAITDTAVLVRFPGLTLLNTEGTALKAGDMDVVASLPLLGQLQMDGRHFSGSTVDHIAGLPNLTHLNLFELSVNIDMSAFARLHQVTNLLFYSATPAAFDDEFWKAVATLEKLESLVFGASGTGELFAGALPMPQLRDLTVQSGHVRGSTVAKAMSKFPNLTFLEVRHSAWTDEDVRLLHDFKSLRQLNLPGNKASAEAIKALSTALPACTIESDHGTFGAVKTE